MEDITFDNVIFPRANSLSLLLYEMNGVSLYIPLPNADLMSFIKFFKSEITCHDHICFNQQKEITLFIYEDNTKWLIKNAYFDQLPQIKKINIFCSSEISQQFWRDYTRRYGGKIEEIFLSDDLNIKLLLFGFNFLKDLQKCEQFSSDNGIKNRLKEDCRRISEVLADYFLNIANNLNEE